MAHTKAGGSTQLGRESQSKRLGVKVGDGQVTRAGQVIVRQRGTKVHPGRNVRRGADDTLYAGMAGIVRFIQQRRPNAVGHAKHRTIVEVTPAPNAAA